MTMKYAGSSISPSPLRSAGRVVALMLVLALSPGMEMAAEAGHGCRASTSSGARILDQTPHGVVFRKRDSVYACLFRFGSVRRIAFAELRSYPENAPARTEARKPLMAGRYVGYERIRVRVGESLHARMAVFDVRRGRHVYSAPAHSGYGDQVGGTVIRSFVIKANGSTAWIASQGSDEDVRGEVRRFEIAATGSELLDGPAREIDQRSIALSADRTIVYWMRDGVPRAASLN